MSTPTQNAVPSSEDIQLIDLPDECLSMIFDNLCFLDLHSVFQTCRRFGPSAVYSTRSANKAVRIASTPKDRGHYYVEVDQSPFGWRAQNFSDLKNLFENLGDCIRSLELFAGNASDMTQILLLANQYCGVNLKSLSLELVVLGENRIDDFANVFKHLETLRLENTTISDTVIFMRTYKTILQNAALRKCLGYCQNLKELTVLGTIFDGEDTRILLELHPKLKSIKVPGIFLPIPQYLNHLSSSETLLVDLKTMPLTTLQQIDWTKLFQLENLSHLELMLKKTTPLTDLSLRLPENPSTNIQTLVLKTYHFNDVYDILTSFTYTNLKKLVIYFDYRCLKSGHNQKPPESQQLIRNLRNVEDLQLIMFTRGMLNDWIGALVRNTPNLKRLTLLPLIGMQISLDDVGQLVEIQKVKNRLLKVYHESSMWRTYQEILKSNDGGIDKIEFNTINQLKYEFSYLYGWKRWTMAKCNIFI